MNFFNTIRLGFLFVILLIIHSCSDVKQTSNSKFEELYQKEESVKNQEFDTISKLFQQIDSICSINNDDRIKYLKNLVHGHLYYRIGEYNQSIDKLQNAIEYLNNNTSTDSLKAKAYNSLGVVFMAKCQYDSAIYYYNRSLKTFERLNDKKNCQMTNFNKAQLYFEMEDYAESLWIIDKILAAPENKDIEWMALHLKANLYGVQGDINRAIKISKTTIQRIDASKNIAAYSRFLNNLSLCYNELKQFDSAIYYCRQSYAYDSLQNNKINMGANLMLMGEILMKMNLYQPAEEFFFQALQIFEEIKSYENIKGAILSLKRLAIKEKKFEKAMIWQDSIFNIDKKIANTEVLRTIALLNIQYEIDKKNELLKSQMMELRRQRQMGWIISILSIVLITTIYLFFQNKSKKEKLKSAKYQKKLADIVFEAEQNEQIRIAKDLHDSVGQKLAVTQMYLSMGGKNNKETHEISTMINDAIDEIRSISHNLLPPDLSKGLFYAIRTLCDQINYSNHLPKVDLTIYENTLNIKINRNIEMIIYRIIQELCGNSIKHSHGENIWIDMKVDSNILHISYKDDGVGFSENDITTSGIGLKNIKERVSKLNGEYKFTTAINKGVQYEFQFNTQK